MITVEEIKQLTKQEKLQLMEVIWQQLSVDEHEIDVPESHKKLLKERSEMAKSGEAEFLDWNEAKHQINKAVQ